MHPQARVTFTKSAGERLDHVCCKQDVLERGRRSVQSNRDVQRHWPLYVNGDGNRGRPSGCLSLVLSCPAASAARNTLSGLIDARSRYIGWGPRLFLPVLRAKNAAPSNRKARSHRRGRTFSRLSRSAQHHRHRCRRANCGRICRPRATAVPPWMSGHLMPRGPTLRPCWCRRWRH